MLHQPRLLVRPEIVLRWHRDLIARRHARRSRPLRPGRPPTIRSIRTLVLRLASENSSRGYRRIHGEPLAPGMKVAASTVWEILKDAGVDPAPDHTSSTWATFLRSQAQANHRPHRGIANTRPRAPLPEPITEPATPVRLRIHRNDRLGGLIHEYENAA